MKSATLTLFALIFTVSQFQVKAQSKTVNDIDPSLSSAADKVTGRLKAGNIAPNAKYLDVDKMYYFSQGAALVQKGSSMALIDVSGNLIVPFSKYYINNVGMGTPGFAPVGYVRGLFPVRELSTNREGYLNSKGKFYPMADPTNGYMYSDYMAFQNANQSYTYIDNNFNIYPMKRLVNNFREGLGVGSDDGLRNVGGKVGYKNINDQFVIKPQYEDAKSFWEGRAVVGKKNEFGEMKYGFIDKTGKEIFPCVLSNEPSHFSSGFARIEPKDKTEFDYAYINRNGQIVIKRKIKDGVFGSFIYGYAYTLDRAMDTTGKDISMANLLNKLGIGEGLSLVIPDVGYYNLYSDDFLAEKIVLVTWSKNRNLVGIFDFKTRKTIPPKFEVKSDLRFDKIAKLAYAQMIIGYDQEHQQDILREGYINEDGIFVIVKGLNSKW